MRIESNRVILGLVVGFVRFAQSKSGLGRCHETDNQLERKCSAGLETNSKPINLDPNEHLGCSNYLLKKFRRGRCAPATENKLVNVDNTHHQLIVFAVGR